MNKNELAAAVAAKSGLTKKVSETAINAVIDTITETLKAGDKIVLVGFGSFETRARAERTGINPATKAKITIPASKAIAFKAGKVLKDAVN